MSTIVEPHVRLSGETVMPLVGLGTYQISDAHVEPVLEEALEIGYRHVDTAAIYRNEAGVGRALKNSGLARRDFFVTTKLWNSDQGYESTKTAYEQSLLKLGLDYVDLYLIHWPAPARNMYLASWRAMHDLLQEGRVGAIGVSNFSAVRLREVVALGLTVPAVNQIEVHPEFQPVDWLAANDELGVLTQAWSPLAHSRAVRSPVVAKVAELSGRTPAQIVLRWHLQRGRAVLPKSVNGERLAENFRVFDFDLSSDQLTKLDRLNTGSRIGPDPELLL